MDSNSSTNCITHLRERHQLKVGRSVSVPHSAETEVMDLSAIATRAAESISVFTPPNGYQKDSIPDLRDRLSIMHVYGCKCTNPTTRDTRWFCFCSDSCISRSLKGSGGISLRGYTVVKTVFFFI